MPECDCRRPTTSEGIYHETTCALRLTERAHDAAAAASWRAVVDAYESVRFTDEANDALVAAFIREHEA